METLTRLGHLSGMLDRDLRTAKLIDFNKILVKEPRGYYSNSTQTEENQLYTISHVPRRTSPHIIYKSRKYGQTWKSILRLGHLVVVVGIYISLLSFLPTTHSAPTNIKMMKDPRMNEPPKWINPCEIRTDDTNTGTSRQVSDAELLERIIVQANNANTKAKNMKEDFVQKTFNTNSEQVHDAWKQFQYSWLPSNKDEVPKELGQSVPKEHLEGLKLDETLLNTYQYLQTIAVGLEQIVWDQEDERASFTSLFKEAQDHLRNVLCEIQFAIFERNIKMRPDVTREVMPENIRSLDNTSTNIRNWIIYRDYMNTLEYIIEAFSHIKETLTEH